MNENLKAIKDLIDEIDLASKGMSTNYSMQDMNKKLKEQFVAIFGKENPNYMDMKRSPYTGEFFAIIEEAIQSDVENSVAEELPFVEYRNIAWGDSISFDVENSDLFDVYSIATGNGNMIRQRLENGKFSVVTEAYGIKIFENFKALLAGRIDWAKLKDKVALSYSRYVKQLINLAFYNSTPVNGNPTFNIHLAGGFDVEQAYELADHVQAENGNSDVVIVGTRQALRNFTPVIATEQANKDMYEKGFYETAEGYKLVVLDQMHKLGTYDFLLDNKQVMIMPVNADDKIVKVVQEGTPIITDAPIGKNEDYSVEYKFYVEVGVAIVTSTKYGKLTWD